MVLTVLYVPTTQRLTSHVPPRYVIASYPVEIRDETAQLEAGLSSDFLHDDLSLSLYDVSGRLVRYGAHRRSFSHLLAAVPPGRYLLKVTQSLSAKEAIDGGGAGHEHGWVEKRDGSGQLYFANDKLAKTQWHRPPSLAGDFRPPRSL